MLGRVRVLSGFYHTRARTRAACACVHIHHSGAYGKRTQHNAATAAAAFRDASRCCGLRFWLDGGGGGDNNSLAFRVVTVVDDRIDVV